MSVLGVAVGSQASKVHALGSARMLASGSVAATTELAEVARAVVGRDAGRSPPLCPSATRPPGASLPPFSSASQAVARGPVETRVARVGAVVARLAGARAGSVAVPSGLVEKEHGVAIALQCWRPDRVDDGVCCGVSALRRWQLELAS
jgi:hypothetical protein